MEIPKVIKDYFLKLYLIYGANPIPINNLYGASDNNLLSVPQNHDWTDTSDPINTLSVYASTLHGVSRYKPMSQKLIDFLMSDSNFYEREKNDSY